LKVNLMVVPNNRAHSELESQQAQTPLSPSLKAYPIRIRIGSIVYVVLPYLLVLPRSLFLFEGKENAVA
jgi:hypothetical protein